MSFKKGGYLRLWEHHPTEYKYNVGRANSSRYYDGEYRQDFSGFVRFVGKAKEKIEEMPNDRMRIKVLDCCVTNRYDKRNRREYVNYVIFDFETVSWKGGGGQCTDSTTQIHCS